MSLFVPSPSHSSKLRILFASSAIRGSTTLQLHTLNHHCQPHNEHSLFIFKGEDEIFARLQRNQLLSSFQTFYSTLSKSSDVAFTLPRAQPSKPIHKLTGIQLCFSTRESLHINFPVSLFDRDLPHNEEQTREGGGVSHMSALSRRELSYYIIMHTVPVNAFYWIHAAALAPQACMAHKVLPRHYTLPPPLPPSIWAESVAVFVDILWSGKKRLAPHRVRCLPNFYRGSYLLVVMIMPPEESSCVPWVSALSSM